jgi:hypothetical protein
VALDHALLPVRRIFRPAFFHALEDLVSRPLFPGYEPTLDPWQFLRDLFGVLVIVGLGVALSRRLFVRDMRRTPASRTSSPWAHRPDGGSGFLLEASKMVSPAVFDRMAADYLPAPDEADLAALRDFWTTDRGMVFPETAPGTARPSAGLLEKGRDLSEASCAPCHSPPRSAFVSAPLSRILAPSDAGRDAFAWCSTSFPACSPWHGCPSASSSHPVDARGHPAAQPDPDRRPCAPGPRRP